MVMALENLEQIKPRHLYDLLQQEHDIFLLDVRNPDEFENWKIESRYTPETVNIPYYEFFENEEEAFAQIQTEKQLVIVCAYGGSSDMVAGLLEEEGIQAVNVEDGMIGWGNLYVTRTVVKTSTYQIYQVDRPSRGCLSYVLISDGKAAIIDPLRHTENYTGFLEEKSAQLVHLFDTHGHADHISGGPALAKETGASYHLHPYDGIHPFDMLPARLSYNMLHDGKQFTLGELEIRVIHTPGHTLGQVNFLVTASDNKSYLFSGDNLFIQSFGRPDLGGQGEAWAPVVYETIFETIKTSVPEDALILPGHYAQHIEANENGLFAKPLKQLWKENNDLAKLTKRETFISFVLDHLPTLPEQYIQIKRVNAGLAHPDEDEASELELGKNICALSTAY